MAPTNTRPWLAAGAVACIAVAAFVSTDRTPPRGAVPSLPQLSLTPQATDAQTLLGRLPLAFERADGHEHGFVSRGPGRGLQLTASGATFEVRGARPARDENGTRPAAPASRVRMHLVDGDATARAQPLEPQPGSTHYFRGSDPAGWQRNVSRFQKVRYDQVYPGVDLVYYGNQRNLEYDFVVAPGADPARIALAFDGVDEVALDAAGNLVLSTPHGRLIQQRPVVYQEDGAGRQPVEGRYTIHDRRVAFEIGHYDRSRTLVIDPVITYGTYIGGADGEIGYGVAADAQGNIYVTGVTYSTDFPLLSAADPYPGGDRHDAFVAKYTASGALVYSTYLSGSQFDQANDIAVDASGHAYIIGETDSPDFPTMLAIQTGPNSPGGRSVFVTRLGATGALEFSTYLGGGADYGESIAVDGAGNAYITGLASYGFPTTPGVLFPTTQWGDDAFVAKIDTNTGTLRYSTYLDGPDTSSYGEGIAVDAAGNAYVTGQVRGHGFPVVGGYSEPDFYNMNVFVAKLSADATSLLYSGYFGGTGTDWANAIAIDGAGNAFITGQTDSVDLPLLAAAQTTYGGGTFDAFVAKLSTTGGGLLYSTYLGGNDTEGLGGNYIDIAVDAGGNAHVAGTTFSADFPVKNAIQPTRVGTQTGFLTTLSPSGAMIDSTFLGAEQYSYTWATAVAVDKAGNAYVTGYTDGDQLPVPGAADATLNSNYFDAFVLRIGTPAPAEPRLRTDFDGDGRDDVVWRHAGNGADTIWLAANAATQRAMTDIRNLDWEVVGIGDFDGNNRPDVFWRNRATGANVVWRNADYGSQVATNRITDLAWRVVGTGDFDGDGKDDVVWRNNRTGANTLWRSGSYATRRPMASVGNLAWKIVGVGDFDKDGRDDILWRNGATGANTLWPAGDSAHSRALTRITDLAWQVVAVGDFNGDGADDVFWRHSGSGRNAIWKSASYATQQAVTGVTNRDWNVEASGDYDGDGKDDVLWRNSTTGSNAIWRSGNSATPRAITRVTDTAWRVVP
jgi:hypothetical protein